jgi:hypothetical protein
MKSAIRTVAVACTLAWSVAAEAAALKQEDERAVQTWAQAWWDENYWQCVPTPQMLYVFSQPWEDYPLKREESDGRLFVTNGFRALYNFNHGYRYKIYEGGWRWLFRHTFIIRSVVWDVPDDEFEEPHYAFRVFSSRPVLSLRPPKVHDRGFSWGTHVRAPAMIRSVALSEAQYEDDNPFTLNIPKRLCVYGDDLRVFETSLRFNRWDDTGFGGSRWPMLLLRWSPPAQDEMLSMQFPMAK